MRRYFGFSKSETNGFILLIPLMALILFSPIIYKKVLLYNNLYSTVLDELSLKDWVKEVENNTVISIQEDIKKREFNFNPNRVNYDELIELGFEKKVSNRIINYRKAGGSFKSKKGLLNIYGISEKRVKELWDFITIPPKKHPKITAIKKSDSAKTKYKRYKKAKEIIYQFDLNTSHSDTLMKIRGIGRYYSKSIVEYREKLGGFTDINQLWEIYGMKEEVLEKVRKNTTLDTSVIEPININSDSIKILLKHPYISYNLAKAIVSYKRQHGRYMEVESITKIKLVSDSLYIKLEPYLSVD